MQTELKSNYWSAPKIWDGETCAILAGGPSLSKSQVDAVRASGVRCIAINNSYLLAPWADLLYFCDLRWWEWHKGSIEFKMFIDRAKYGEAIICTLENTSLSESNAAIKSLQNSGRNGIECDPRKLRTGSNSGYQAINLSVHLGIKRILLLGYDMRTVNGISHWHSGHPVKTPESVYSSLMMPAYNDAVKPLSARGVTVINCTPDSALKVFPQMTLSEALNETSRRNNDSSAASL